MSRNLLLKIQFEWLNSSVWAMGRTLTGNTTPGQSWPRSNGYEDVFLVLKPPKLEP